MNTIKWVLEGLGSMLQTHKTSQTSLNSHIRRNERKEKSQSESNQNQRGKSNASVKWANQNTHGWRNELIGPVNTVFKSKHWSKSSLYSLGLFLVTVCIDCKVIVS